MRSATCSGCSISSVRTSITPTCDLLVGGQLAQEVGVRHLAAREVEHVRVDLDAVVVRQDLAIAAGGHALELVAPRVAHAEVPGALDAGRDLGHRAIDDLAHPVVVLLARQVRHPRAEVLELDVLAARGDDLGDLGAEHVGERARQLVAILDRARRGSARASTAAPGPAPMHALIGCCGVALRPAVEQRHAHRAALDRARRPRRRRPRRAPRCRGPSPSRAPGAAASRVENPCVRSSQYQRNEPIPMW